MKSDPSILVLLLLALIVLQGVCETSFKKRLKHIGIFSMGCLNSTELVCGAALAAC